MKILVIGSGGREHCICWKIKQNKNVRLFALPGNGGISEIAECIKGDIEDFSDAFNIIKNKGIDFVVVGPENPLVYGIVDFLKEKNIKAFGPIKKGAILEGSKCYAKEFMGKYNIPTANFQIAESYESAIKIIEKKEVPYVIKYDGLAAGKGVRVIESFEEGEKYLKEIFIDNIFKSNEKKIIIEDCLIGKELSYLIFTDTISYIPMVPAKDYKRVFDGDKGQNTGGMGSYSPPLFFNEELDNKIKNEIVERTIYGLRKENIDYRGVLYFGLMITEKGPYVLEYNVRFGDPETQVILPRMETDIIDVMTAVCEGELKKIDIKWSNKKSVCVILSSGGYPGGYETGKEIKNLEKVEKSVLIFHSGTKKENGKFYTNGGRVLGITALNSTIEKARENVYKAANTIDFEGKHYRKDIALF